MGIDPNYSIWREMIKGGIGLGGKVLMGAADSVSGGLASKLLDVSTSGLTKHSGLIGKVAKGLGESFLSDSTRNKIANIADTALKYVPEGNVKTALSSINKSAKGESVESIKAPLEKSAYTPKPEKPFQESDFSTNHHSRTYI